MVGLMRVLMKPAKTWTSDATVPSPFTAKDEGQREERNTMGDKGKKDKEKGQKQNTDKQHQKDKKKADKQPKRTS